MQGTASQWQGGNERRRLETGRGGAARVIPDPRAYNVANTIFGGQWKPLKHRNSSDCLTLACRQRLE
jgi:hypothetical protein